MTERVTRDYITIDFHQIPKNRSLLSYRMSTLGLKVVEQPAAAAYTLAYSTATSFRNLVGTDTINNTSHSQ
jgi:hypothetical protein